MPNKISLSKENIQNIQEQAASQARQQAPVGVRPGASRPGAGGPPPPPRKVEPVRTEKKVLPNDPCPCGSGKKYKKCHG